MCRQSPCSMTFGRPSVFVSAFVSAVLTFGVGDAQKAIVQRALEHGVNLRIVADELLDYEPDVFIVFSGHNEFIEPAFYETLKSRDRGLDHGVDEKRAGAPAV